MARLTLLQLETALRAADAAGAEADARELAAAYRARKAELEAYSPTTPRAAVTGSFGENAVAGFGKAFVDTGRGIKQLAAEAGNKLDLVSDATVAGIQADADEAKRTDAELMRTGGGLVGNLAGQGAQFAIPGAAITKAAPAALTARSALAAPALSGGVLAATQPVASDESRAGNMALGAAGGAGGQLLAKGIGRVAKGAADVIRPEVAALARAAEARGIPVTADQLVNSKPLNAVRATLQYLPFSGASGTQQAQQKAFNTALAKTIGETTDNPAAAVAAAETRLSGEFDRVLKGTAVRADAQLQNDLIRVVDEAGALLPDAQAKVIRGQVDNLLAKVQAGDVIDGEAAYTIKKQLDRLSKSQDSSLAYAARDLRGVVFDALNRSLGPQEAKGFAKTREQWGNLRELQRLIPAGAEADISPARLAQAKGRFRSDELKELSDIAGQFLKGRIGDSGTAQRAGVMGALFGGSLLDPTTAAVAGGTGLTAGRAANALLSSRGARNYLTEGLPMLEQYGVPVTNALLPTAGMALPNALRQ